MAGKYWEWLEPENLEKVANWAANGCTNDEIARNMGVGRTTFYSWLKAHPDVSDAVKRGRALAREAVENALFKRAVGYVTVEVTEAVDGDGRTVRRTVTRELPPDTTAIIFYLKNRMPERYSDRRVNEVEVISPAIVLGVEPSRAG